MGNYFGLNPGQVRIGEVIVSLADRQPCPICGHPTGDCVGDSGPPHHVWGLGDVPSMEDDQTFLVEENVYEERQITPFTRAKVLLVPKGRHIPLKMAKELGLFTK